VKHVVQAGEHDRLARMAEAERTARRVASGEL
jgi:hypothetical protein